jgi:fermentation-respiration switch protein FrsA (DUF1100 family)
MLLARPTAAAALLVSTLGALATEGGAQSAAPLPGPGSPPDSAAFLIVAAGDTIGVERFARSADTLTGELRLRRPVTMRLAYGWALDPASVVRRMSLQLWQGAEAAGAAPTQRATLAFGGDSVRVQNHGSQPVRHPVRDGAVPFFNPSFVAMEQIVRRARSLGGDSVSVPVFGLIGGLVLDATVLRRSPDSVTVRLGGMPIEVALDAEERVTRAWVPSQKLRVVRAAWSAADAVGATAAPPSYAAPPGAPYEARDVVVPTPMGHTLAGTLTMPTGRRGRVPAVITISGSGPQERDERLPGVVGYAPFAQLADTLGRRGIAVLRLDDRGVGQSRGSFGGATSADFADDVRAAIAWLRAQPEVDASRIALVGHSEGGLIAPMVAADTGSGVRAVVLLAAPARRGRAISRAQQRYVLEQDTLRFPAARHAELLAQAAEQADSVARTDAWTRYWFDHDPLATARRVRQPVLIVHGETDRQVEPAQADELATALRAGGNRQVTVRRLPATNHLFLADSSGNPAGYTALPSTRVSADALGTVADWLARELDASGA